MPRRNLTLRNEEEVRSFYAAAVNAERLEQEHIDILTDSLLIECKFQHDLQKKDFYTVLAQTLFYANVLYQRGEERPYLVLCSEREVVILPSEQFQTIYRNNEWFVNISSGSQDNPKLVKTLKDFAITKWYYAGIDEGISALKEIEEKGNVIQKRITEYNVRESLEHWLDVVREYLVKTSENEPVAFAFMKDATNDRKQYAIESKNGSRNGTLSNGKLLVIEFNDFQAISIKFIPEAEYESWEIKWQRLETDSAEAQALIAKIYEMVGMDDRRRKGQFYTPHRLAKLAWSMICEQLGEKFWEDGTWRIWDNSAGSGNLEYDVIPKEALQYLYLSTINVAEVEYMQSNKYFTGKCAGIFQFDWLNDHNKKLPKELRDDLENKNLNWLFFINPPYAESGTGIGREYKTGVKLSNVAEEMKNKRMNKSANELKMQFIYRIERDFGKHGYYLGLFSTPKWITKSSQEEFRKIWHPNFDGGFMLNASEHFVQQRDEKFELKAHGQFPIIFSLLDRCRKTKSWEQDWAYTILDKQAITTETKKTFLVFDKERLGFREYFFPLMKGEKKKPLPIMSGAVLPSSGKSRLNGKVITDFVGSVKIASVDFQDKEKSFIQSSLPTSHEVCISTTNYKSILIGYALYKSVKFDWTKNQDIFYAPYRDLTKAEKADCLLYALLESKNNTATTRVGKQMLYNWFNPFDKTKFDWKHLSKTGKQAFAELQSYCGNVVHWKELETPYGKGKWLGLYQYRTDYEQVNRTYKKKFGVDYPNKDLYGIAYPDSFTNAIEELRKHIEALAIELCLSPNKEILRMQETFLIDTKQKMF